MQKQLNTMMRHLSHEQSRWIQEYLTLEAVQALAGDAGFRRYFRLTTAETTWIFMDASEEPAIYQAFIQQSQHLRQSSLPLPRILAQQNEKSWAIVEDFGDDLLWHLLQSSKKPLSIADVSYKEAMLHLITLHRQPIQAYGRLSILDKTAMLGELEDWQTWCLEGLFKKKAPPRLHDCFDLIANFVAKQPYVLIHRDFHSKNILRKKDGGLGIIDYQDAMAGPISYDIASLLRDCYVDWPEENVKTWALFYKQQAQDKGLLESNLTDANFLAWFDWTSIQRHLKALFTFSRKSLRDQNDNYLIFIPRTLRYLETISGRYPTLAILTKTLSDLREEAS